MAPFIKCNCNFTSHLFWVELANSYLGRSLNILKTEGDNWVIVVRWKVQASTYENSWEELFHIFLPTIFSSGCKKSERLSGKGEDIKQTFEIANLFRQLRQGIFSWVLVSNKQRAFYSVTLCTSTCTHTQVKHFIYFLMREWILKSRTTRMRENKGERTQRSQTFEPQGCERDSREDPNFWTTRMRENKRDKWEIL